jgi:hypothetical protein
MVLSSPRASRQQSLSCSSLPLGQIVLKHPSFDHHEVHPLPPGASEQARSGEAMVTATLYRWATIRWKGHSCQSGWPKKRLADHSTAPTSWAWCSRFLGSQGHLRKPQLYCGLGRIGSPQRRIRRRNASHQTARLDHPSSLRLNFVVVDRTDSAEPKVGQWHRHV